MAVWDDKRVASHVRDAAKEIASTFGITNIGGFASSGHIPGSDHYTGHALDVMTLTNIAKGNEVAAWAVANASRLSIKYVIWYRKIWYPGKGWQPYSGTSPHVDHVHLSFNTTAGDGSQPIQGFGARPTDTSGCANLVLKIFGQKGN